MEMIILHVYLKLNSKFNNLNELIKYVILLNKESLIWDGDLEKV